MNRREEINLIIENLKTHWLNNPELRLGQLIENLKPNTIDTFYVSDNELLGQLTKENK